jgi:hypothetical protein
MDDNQQSPLLSVRDRTKPHITYLILADRAEVKDGRLYMMGGNTPRIPTSSVPTIILLSIAVGLSLPQREAAISMSLRISVQARERREIYWFGATVDMPPEPSLEPGEIEHRPLAFPTLPVLTTETGLYYIVAYLNGAEEARISYVVKLDPTAMSFLPTPAQP